MLQDGSIKAYMNSETVPEDWWTPDIVSISSAVKVHRDDRQFPLQSLFDFPPNKLDKISGAVAYKEHKRLGVIKANPQLRLNRYL
jgi:hypothetical protein